MWVNEGIGGKEVFSQLGVVLAATGRLVAGSSIANLWARHPAAMQGGASVLADSYPGRFVLGVGVSMGPLVEGSGQEWRPPLQRMRGYLDQMDASADRAPSPSVPFPRIVGALGPKMHALSAERADGALPATMPVEHTRRAREILGPDKLLVVLQGVVPETDPSTARGIVRQATGRISDTGTPYNRALKETGYSDADLRDGGSDALIDARFPWGDGATIAKRLQAHLDAGADHVCITVFAPDLASSVDQFERIAPAVLAP